MTSMDHPDYSIIEIGQNTEISGVLGKLAVTQTPVENYQLMLVLLLSLRLLW